LRLFKPPLAAAAATAAAWKEVKASGSFGWMVSRGSESWTDRWLKTVVSSGGCGGMFYLLFSSLKKKREKREKRGKKGLFSFLGGLRDKKKREKIIEVRGMRRRKGMKSMPIPIRANK